jgi:hypothetical protein
MVSIVSHDLDGDERRMRFCRDAVWSGDAAVCLLAAIDADPCQRFGVVVFDPDDDEAAEWIEAAIETGFMSARQWQEHLDAMRRMGRRPAHVAAWCSDMIMKVIVTQCYDPEAVPLAERALADDSSVLCCVVSAGGVMLTCLPLVFVMSEGRMIPPDHRRRRARARRRRRHD